MVCWGERGLPAAGWMPQAWWYPGSISGTSTPPTKEQILQVGSAGCWDPFPGGHHLCCVTRGGAFWEGVYSFLAWKPFGTCFDLHFHFFFMLLEQCRANREADTINFETQLLRRRLGKGRPGGGGEGPGVQGVIKDSSSSSNVRASLPARHSRRRSRCSDGGN